MVIYMVEENIIQVLRLKNIEEIKNYFIQEIGQIELMGKKHKNGIIWNTFLF